MRTKTLFIAIFLLQALLGNAQDKGYLAIGLGGSIPIGDFASTGANNERAGYAGVGGVFEFDFAHLIKGNFGIAATLRGTANYVDAQPIADQFALATGVGVKVETGYWGSGGLVLGGYGSFGIGGKTHFEAKALFGFAQATSPTLKFSRYDGGSLLAEQKDATATCFTYVIATGFKFDVGARTCLLAGLDYQGLEPEFKDVRIHGADGSVTRTSFKQPYSMVNVVFGVAYRL